MRPYKDGDRTLVDVQQLIPLPEAHDYQVQLREKGSEGRKQRAERYDIRQKFWEGVVAIAKEHNGRHAKHDREGEILADDVGHGARGLSPLAENLRYADTTSAVGRERGSSGQPGASLAGWRPAIEEVRNT